MGTNYSIAEIKHFARSVSSVAFFLGLLAGSIAPAMAELIVFRVAGVDNISIGATFPDDKVFKLPAESELGVLKSPENTPYVIRGPYEGTLQSCIEKRFRVFGLIVSRC
jgi:hypothetical protein